MNEKPRIVVVGSVNTDLVIANARFPVVGETVTGGTFRQAGGGKGANQAVAAARLGAAVTLVARLGTDSFGDSALSELAAEGISTEHIGRDPEVATGVALILVDGRGNNLISVAPGANRALSDADVERAAGAIRAADLVLMQLEISPGAVHATARIAAEANVPLLLDPAPAPAGPLHPELTRLLAFVKPNEIEATRLTGIPVTDFASAHAAAARLVEDGARCAIVTLGAQGAVWRVPDRAGEVPPCPVQAVDCTAAGDAFAAGLASALGRGVALPDALRYATLVAALSTTRPGARPSLPTRQDVRAFAARLTADLVPAGAL